MRDYLDAYLTFTGRDHAFLHDPFAIGVASDDAFATVETGAVIVGTDLGLHRGQTVFIADSAAQQPALPEAVRDRAAAARGSVAVGAGAKDFTADFVQRLRGPARPAAEPGAADGE